MEADIFTNFEPELQKKIQQVGVMRKFQADDFLMKTGQSIRSAVFVTKGIIKVFREDDEGNEVFEGEVNGYFLKITVPWKSIQISRKED